MTDPDINRTHRSTGSVDPTATQERRQALESLLHDRFTPGAYDNWIVWAGALSAQIGALRFDATLARAYVDAEHPATMQARVELFVADVETTQIRDGDIDVRMWSDAIQTRGSSKGELSGGYVPMQLAVDDEGRVRLCEANLVFQSDPVPLTQPGTYAYTVEFSADGKDAGDPAKRWVPLNDLAQNRDGVIVVSPAWVEAGPTMMEVCLRKLGARHDGRGRFHSGHIEDLTAVVADQPVDVIYLLPFFRPGFTDLHTGADVRKGELGSPYAVADFFALDPQLVPEPAQIDLSQLLADGLFDAQDVDELFVPPLPTPAQLARAGAQVVAEKHGEDRLRQLVGRAHLRALTRAAHAAGKRVIFDLVLMQTSRDHELIRQHPEWYVREADGRPAIHRIAWLEYSDVALFDLIFNEPLQQYLLDIAPFWIERCDLDGVRIDASQTVDRPFLKRLHNRIHAVRSDALVLGETLCPLEEADDIPVDMIYALLVDFHRDVQEADHLIDFLELMHSTFAAGTVAKAYFENHDSPRATAIWHDRYLEQLPHHDAAQTHWTQMAPERPALTMALAKNLQASLIDASMGMAPAATPIPEGQRPHKAGGCRLAWALEWGSQWGERARSDFENPTLLHAEDATRQPGARLVDAYAQLPTVLADCHEFFDGAVYYHRSVSDDDRILAATRYVDGAAIVVLHNLDPFAAQTARIDLSWLTTEPMLQGIVYDSYDALHLAPVTTPTPSLQGPVLQTNLAPLQSRFLRLGLPTTQDGSPSRIPDEERA